MKKLPQESWEAKRKLLLDLSVPLRNDYGPIDEILAPAMEILDRYLTSDRQRVVERNNLANYLQVVQHLKQYGRNRLIKCDERSEGFYEAIKEIEEYFGLREDYFIKDKL
jgi:hypothetical protein